MGLSLETTVLERDWDDSAVEQNLRLSYQDRWDNAIRSARFIERGRQEVRTQRVRPR